MKRNIIFFALLLTTAGAADAQSLSLSLQDCRRLALENNEKVKTADNAVEKAKLDRKIAFAQYLPKLDASATGIHMKDQNIIGMSLQTRGTYLAGLNLTMPIYVGGRLTSANRLAKIGQTVSEEQRRKTRMQIIADVDNAYYTLISVLSKVKMLEAYEQQMQSLYDRVRLSYDVKMATSNDLLRISTKQNEVSYMLQKARNGEQLCQLALANIIGTDFEQIIIPTDTVLVANNISGLSEDFSNRPDLLLLQQNVKAHEAMLKQSRANYLPTVALMGVVSHYDNLKLKGALRNLDGTPINVDHKFSGGNPYVMLNVQVPILHWGAEIRKMKKAKFDLLDSQLQLQQYERGMRIEVRQAVLNITDGQRMVETATIGQQQADENLRVMRQKYDNQLCTMTDLLDAQSQWQQARSNLIEAQTQLKIYETEYLRVTGRLE